jgi:hypothetical protein
MVGDSDASEELRIETGDLEFTKQATIRFELGSAQD